MVSSTEFIGIKVKYTELKMILHTDWGNVYLLKEFNEMLRYSKDNVEGRYANRQFSRGVN